MRSFSTTAIASSLCMPRRSTLPAARAALTMTLTTGFCMAERLLGEVEGRRRRQRTNPARGPGRAVYHSGMETQLESPVAHPAAVNLRIVLVGTQHPGNI